VGTPKIQIFNLFVYRYGFSPPPPPFTLSLVWAPCIMHRCVIYPVDPPPPVLPIFHFGSLPRRPPPLVLPTPRRSFPFPTPVLYPVRSEGKLLSSCPLTTAHPESGEASTSLASSHVDADRGSPTGDGHCASVPSVSGVNHCASVSSVSGVKGGFNLALLYRTSVCPLHNAQVK
jgi:hypothetical protein